jgi:hypothetical protein
MNTYGLVSNLNVSTGKAMISYPLWFVYIPEIFFLITPETQLSLIDK